MLLISFAHLPSCGGGDSSNTSTYSKEQLSISHLSGIINNGSSIVISGSGFGVHNDYDTSDAEKLCYAWLDFEGTSTFLSGSDAGDGFTPDCNDGDCHQDWLLMTEGNRANSTAWAKRIDLHDSFSCNEHGLKKPSNTAVLYPNIAFVSFWFYIPPLVESGKLYRQWTGNNASTSLFWAATGGEEGLDLRGDDDHGNGPSQTAVDVRTGVWQRFDFLQSGVNLKAWIVGQNSNNALWNWNTFSASNVFFQAVIGSGKDYGGTTATNFYGYDDIYIDFTQARVEICDSSSWIDRTHCEIQIPQTWSSTAITFKVNRGSFGSSETVYICVVDTSGNVSNGYTVQFGNAYN